MVLNGGAQLRLKWQRIMEMIKIEPEKWHAPVNGAGSYSVWTVGIFGNRVLWYNEIKGEFVISKIETYGKIGTDGSDPTEFRHVMEMLIRHVEGEQAYIS